AASRVLLWRVACHAGQGDTTEAQLAAKRFAVLGLEVPPDVGSVSPQVETLLSRALQDAAAAPRVATKVLGDVSPATIAVDGRPAACAAPCSIALVAGSHLFRLDADGVDPAVQEADLAGATATVSLATHAATPDAAA